MLKLINQLNELFINLDNDIKTYALSHNNSITTYLENFSAEIMSTCFDCDFININYIGMNTSGYDLLDKKSNKICQTTIEKVNKSKICNSITKTKNIQNYSKFYFFFLSYEDSKFYKLKCPIDYEIVTLKTIYQCCEQNPQLAKKIKEIFDIWIIKNIDLTYDLYENLDLKFINTLNNNKLLKKYIPEVYIEESNLKNYMRGFCNAEFASKWIKLNLEFIPTSKVSEELDYWGYSDGKKFNINKELVENNTIDLKLKIKNIIDLSKTLFDRNLIINGDTPMTNLTNTYHWGNSSIQFELENVIRTINIFNKKFMLIVKDAGQGKTNLLCDFTETYLRKLKIPYAFININETNDNIYEYLSSRFMELFSLSLQESFRFINNYCKNVNLNFIILLDGLNENNNSHIFYNHLCEFLNLCHNFEHIKVIMTCRNYSYAETFSQLENLSQFKGDIYTVAENNFTLNSYKKSEIFRERIIKAYFDFFNINVVISNDVRRKLSDDTLLLRMFSEVYKDKSGEFVEQINNYLIFKQYLELRALEFKKLGIVSSTEDFFKILKKVCKQMIRLNNLLNFSIDNFNTNEVELINKIVESDILIKKEKKDAIIPEYCYSFVYDEIRDFLFSDIITSEEDTKALEIINGIDLNTFDGIGKYLFIFSKIKNKKSIYDSVSKKKNIFFNSIFNIEFNLINKYEKSQVLNEFHTAMADENYAKCSFFVSKLLFRSNSLKFPNLNISLITNEFIKDLNTKLSNVLYFYDYQQQKYSGILRKFLEEKNKYIDNLEIENIFEFIFAISPIIPFEYHEIFKSLVKKVYKLNHETVDNVLIKYSNLKHNVSIIKEIIC